MARENSGLESWAGDRDTAEVGVRPVWELPYITGQSEATAIGEVCKGVGWVNVVKTSEKRKIQIVRFYRPTKGENNPSHRGEQSKHNRNKGLSKNPEMR
jgi:hypothetical protein